MKTVSVRSMFALFVLSLTVSSALVACKTTEPHMIICPTGFCPTPFYTCRPCPPPPAP